MMHWIGFVMGTVTILIVFVDTFEVMLLPRRIARGSPFARLFYRWSWFAWRRIGLWLRPGSRRNGFLATFGPLSMFGLIVLWASALIFGFALLHWSRPTPLHFPNASETGFPSYLYFSGTTFFTLGYGDIVPLEGFARALAVIEAGIGFGFLAVVISYLPVLYQAFSERELAISMLDARAGSPPSAVELLSRIASLNGIDALAPLLQQWERWSAQLLQSQLSFPVLSYYRSQHDNQSWVGTLTTILDTTALFIVAEDRPENYQAKLTFAMSRHAAVDLCMVFKTPPLAPAVDRLPADEMRRLQALLRTTPLQLRNDPNLDAGLAKLRKLYEPFVNALAAHFRFELPGFWPARGAVDNWQTSAWTPRSPDLSGLHPIQTEEDHFG
ncbi:MAG TPA: potassium channel family protein [Pirellulales bacterium]|jgi:hypothetical protein|nr:potassium channel family protein [Pirellulales bacterium]